MAYRWILHDAAGIDLRVSEDFASQADAEAWMGSEWASLLDQGAESVTLMNGDDKLYRMGLREA